MEKVTVSRIAALARCRRKANRDCCTIRAVRPNTPYVEGARFFTVDERNHIADTFDSLEEVVKIYGVLKDWEVLAK